MSRYRVRPKRRRNPLRRFWLLAGYPVAHLFAWFAEGADIDCSITWLPMTGLAMVLIDVRPDILTALLRHLAW